MYWTLLGIAFVGAVLTTVEGGIGCATSQDIDSVNLSVTALTNGMAPLLTTITDPGMLYHAIFNATCTVEALKTAVANIEAKVRPCPELVASTTLATLDTLIPGLGFTTLFENFATYDQFCDCYPGVLAAKALNEMSGQSQGGLILDQPKGAFHKLVNPSAICALGPMIFEHANKFFGSSCNMTSLNADVYPKDRVIRMRGFAESICTPNFNDTSFQCALAKNGDQAFKYCIEHLIKNVAEVDKNCERTKCVHTYIEGTEDKPQCGVNASIHFRWSVLMAGGKIEISDSTCGASGLFTSAVLLLAAILATKMF